MVTHTAPDTPARRFDIASGASRMLALRAGATLICIQGSVYVQEQTNGSEAAGRLPCAVSVRVNAGESHALAYGGAVCLTAIGGAQVICLNTASPASRCLRWAAAFFQRILAKSGNNRLGALRNISK